MRRNRQKEEHVSWFRNHNEDKKVNQKRMLYNLLGITIILLILVLRLL